MSNETKQKIILALKNKPKTRKRLVKELNIARTTIFDNLHDLEKLKKVERFGFNNKCRGRSIIFWKLLDNSENNIDFLDLSKIVKDIRLKETNEIINKVKFNTMPKKPFKKHFNHSINLRSKKIVKIVKKVKIIKSENNCFNCNREISNTISLIKLKDNNYYCYNCIYKSKEIFDLLKVNGYWYNLINQKKGIYNDS